MSSYWYLSVAGSFKFCNQKSPRWVYVNFNWLASLKEVVYTERNNTAILWWELNTCKQLSKRWNSMCKYGSPAMNRTPVVLMLSYIMWEYGGFPFRMLVQIFLAISFVNSESYREKNFTFILRKADLRVESVLNQEQEKMRLTWKESLWNVKFGRLVQDSIFLPVSCLQVHSNVLVNFCPYKTWKKANGWKCTETMDDEWPDIWHLIFLGEKQSAERLCFVHQWDGIGKQMRLNAQYHLFYRKL